MLPFLLMVLLDICLGITVVTLLRRAAHKERSARSHKKATAQLLLQRGRLATGPIDSRPAPVSLSDHQQSLAAAQRIVSSGIWIAWTGGGRGDAAAPFSTSFRGDPLASFRGAIPAGGLDLTLRLRGAGYALPGGHTVLSNVNANFRSGRLTALMGPSGCGKSTMLHCMFGRQRWTSGTMTINDLPFHRHEHPTLVGFVPQEDVMHRMLTVRSIILHAAKTRLPATWSNAQVEGFADAVIHELDLSHVAFSIIGDDTVRGISGGERKRVNVGIELVSAPAILALDEPTSGLDAAAAMSVMKALRRVASAGVMVVAVIHQPRPEVFDLVDDVVLLSGAGEQVYGGRRENVLPHFSKLGYDVTAVKNAADFVLDVTVGGVAVATPADPDQHEEPVHLLSSNFVSVRGRGTAQIAAIPRRRQPSLPLQIVYDVQRAFDVQLHQALLIAIEFVGFGILGTALGIAIGLIRGQPYQGTLQGPWVSLTPAPITLLLAVVSYAVCMSLVLTSSIPATYFIQAELNTFRREALAGHSTIALSAALLIGNIPRALLASWHFVAVFHMYANLRGPIVTSWIGDAILVLFTNLLGNFTTIVAPKHNPLLIMLVECVVLIMTCGFAPSLATARRHGIAWLFEWSPSKSAAEIFYGGETTQWRNIFRAQEDADIYGFDISDGAAGAAIYKALVLVAAIAVLLCVALASSTFDWQRARSCKRYLGTTGRMGHQQVSLQSPRTAAERRAAPAFGAPRHQLVRVMPVAVAVDATSES